MFSNFLVRRFIKDYDDVHNEHVRNSYGYLGGVFGILVNISVAIIEIIIGLLINSIAITADAFHNLTDVAASAITLIGFKLASKPADEEHPFGHGRIEYISAMIVSFLILLVGFEFVKSSFERIFHPTPVEFSLISVIFILISIPLKLWLSSFFKHLGRSIDSASLKASGVDAFNDVIILSAVVISLLLSKWIGFNLDGYIGVIVAAIILYSGFSLSKETLSPLLGEAPDPKLVEKIKEEVLNYEYISGVHDLVIHNYGPGRCMASIHAEIPDTISVVTIHEIIDKAEREISKTLNIYLVIHMDPVNTDNIEVRETRKELEALLKKFPVVKSMHDFRIVGDGEKKNLIFDLVIENNKKLNDSFEEKLKLAIDKELKHIHPEYYAVITIDRDFTVL